VVREAKKGGRERRERESGGRGGGFVRGSVSRPGAEWRRNGGKERKRGRRGREMAQERGVLVSQEEGSESEAEEANTETSEDSTKVQSAGQLRMRNEHLVRCKHLLSPLSLSPFELVLDKVLLCTNLLSPPPVSAELLSREGSRSLGEVWTPGRDVPLPVASIERVCRCFLTTTRTSRAGQSSKALRDTHRCCRGVSEGWTALRRAERLPS
jgi:hypothetical protein